MINAKIVNSIAVINLDAPPVNALGQAMREAILAKLREMFSDSSVEAVVIGSDLPIFCGGADIEEFKTGALWHVPDLPEVLNVIDTAPKPIIAALNGTAMGGAMELALACDYRIADGKAKFGLPEVNLGLLPAAGGTQRLPRIVGLETATEMILTGRPIGADKALAVGLLDRVVRADQDFQREVLQFAEDLVASNAPIQRTADMQVDCSSVCGSFFEDRRQTIAAKNTGQVAPEYCLRSLEAACSLPLDQALDMDKEAFRALLDTPQARGLIHLFFAERKARNVPGVSKDTPTRDIARVGIIGAGTMGAGIALAFIEAGFLVTLLDMSEESLSRGLDSIAKHYDRAVAKGRVDAAAADHRKAAVTGTLHYADLADADLVIEAVFEDMDIKKKVFRELDRVCKPGAILATNTSTLDLDEIARATCRPGDVVGLHFFSPANIMRLLEVVRGKETAPDVLKTAVTLAKRIGKVPVVVGVCYGFVGNRMLEPYFREGSRLLLEGATPEQVDRVLTDFGMAMGIHSMADLAGIDVGYRVRETRRAVFAHDASYQAIQDKLYALGRYGQKTGRGSYIYEGLEKRIDPEVVGLCEDLAGALGVTRREISDEEVLERCLYPLINEGLEILDEGIATRAGDCDIVWVKGYGFPAWRGGPLHYAQEIGLERVLERLRHYREALGDYGELWFRPAPLLEKLVAEHRGLGE